MTQNQRVLEHLEKYGSLTALEAVHNYGIMRLASRISDLKHQGYNITSDRIKVTNRYGEVTYICSYKLL